MSCMPNIAAESFSDRSSTGAFSFSPSLILMKPRASSVKSARCPSTRLLLICGDCIMVQHEGAFSELHFLTYSSERQASVAARLHSLPDSANEKHFLKVRGFQTVKKARLWGLELYLHVLHIYYTHEWMHLCKLVVNAFKHIKQVNYQFYSTSESSVRQIGAARPSTSPAPPSRLHTLSVWSSSNSSVLFFFCLWDAQWHCFLSTWANLPHNGVHILVRFGDG